MLKLYFRFRAPVRLDVGVKVKTRFLNGKDFLIPTIDANPGTCPTWPDKGHWCREENLNT